jgi:PAS domain S-box-containing protein
MIHVLCVDDEPDLLAITKAFLELPGTIAVDTATSAQQALEMLGLVSYDALVSDFQMPGMDGIALLVRIRKDQGDLPFILFTGRGREEIVIEALNQGADFYLQKGGDPKSQFTELYHKILQAVSRREADEKFRILIEESLVGVYIIKDDRFLHVNDRLAALFGYTPDEIIHDLRVSDLVATEDRDLVASNLQMRFSGEQKSVHYAFRGRHRDGGSIDVEVAGTRAVFHGQPIVVGTLMEMTGFRKVDRDLILANRKIQLLNTLTRHDIANRLTVLRARLINVKKHCADPVLRKQLEKVDDAGKDIYNLLETARIYQEIGVITPQWQNVHEIITTEWKRMAMPSPTLSLMLGGLEVCADPLLDRVFANLLENTVRHGVHVTEIRVSCRRSGAGMTVIWEDNGVGIAADLKERIFEEGFGTNTGLGLFLCREIVSGTGITITETGIPGKGARFEFFIPEHNWRVSGDSLGVSVNSLIEKTNTQS